MKKLLFMVLIVFCAFALNAQEALIDGFETIPGTAGWWTAMSSGTAGQNVNVANGGTLSASTLHVTQGSGSGAIVLNWNTSPEPTGGVSVWPGTWPVWGCRWASGSGGSLGNIPIGDTIKIDIYNDTADSTIKFSLLVRDQSGAGDLVNGPYVTLNPGANTYSFVPQTDSAIWVGLSNGIVDGDAVQINSMLFYSDDLPPLATYNFYVDNLRREGPQTDTTPPEPPILKAVVQKQGTTNQVEISWKANTDDDLFGYRLYKSNTISGNTIIWETAPILNETTLDKNAVSATVTIDSPSTVTLFKITAIDDATPVKNESLAHTPLAVKITGTTQMPQVLSVIDLDRYAPGQSGWGNYEYRQFIMYFAQALQALNEPFISATADGIIDGTVALDPYAYKLVTWSAGFDGNDESNTAVDEDAIPIIINFLNQTGRLYLSGTYIGTSLAATSGGPGLLSILGVTSENQTGGSSIVIPAGSIFSGITAALKTDDMWNYAAYSSTTNNNFIAIPGRKQLEFTGSEDYAAGTSMDLSFKAVVTGFAFESLRQDSSESANARVQFLSKLLAFMGPVQGPPASVNSHWVTYE